VTEWLSFWDQGRRERHDFRTRDFDTRPPLSSTEVPHGKGRVKPDDRVFAVSADRGRLMLIGRVLVDFVTEDDPLDEGSATAIGRDGMLVPPRFDRFDPKEIVARLQCRDIHGFEVGANPEFVFVDMFHGDQSLLELVAGGEVLDELIEPGTGR